MNGKYIVELKVNKVKKAVIPAAGMGTRFLPISKSIPKEMLPIVDKPVLQYVIEEAIGSGIEDILIITSRSKRSIEDHFDFNPEFESFVAGAGKGELIQQSRDIGSGANIHYLRQKEQLGLGDAVRLARWHVGDEPFAVLLGDTIIDTDSNGKPPLRQLLDVYEQKDSSVVAVKEVPLEAVSSYGIVDGEAEADNADLLRLRRLVEKPSPEESPSRLAIEARYVFTPEIFQFLDETEQGVGGEIQLTDAMNMLAKSQAMYALAWQAERYDIGSRFEYTKCFLDFALRREDIGPAVRDYIKAISESQ